MYPAATPLQVLLVDDHEVVRIGVRHLLEAPGGLSPLPHICEASTLDGALQLLRGQRFDLLLLDLGLGEDFSLRALPQLRAQAPSMRIVVLTSMAEHLYAEQSLRAGADGYLMKSELGHTLCAAVRTVMAGDVYLSERQRGDSLRQLAGRGGESRRPALSARELEVLRLVAAGHSTKEIADELNRSVKTIETHKQNLKDKLGAQTPAQLMRQGMAWFGEQL